MKRYSGSIMNKGFAEFLGWKITFSATDNFSLTMLLSPWAGRRACRTSRTSVWQYF